MGEKVRGNLVIIGGHEDKTGNCTILRRLVTLAGGREAVLLVLTTASQEGEATGRDYHDVFTRLGAAQVMITHVRSRWEADDPGQVRLAQAATGVFFTGGDQLRITATLGGTALGAALQECYEAGVVVAGTSAGASAMSGTMILGGPEDDAPKKCTTAMAPGLGLLEEVVIDQHFAQRGRLGRLLSAVAQNPYVIGLGIDEDTAVVVRPDACFEVIGSRTVTVADGSRLMHSNASDSRPDDPLALLGVLLHTLPSGYGYDLRRRQPVVPS